MKVHGFSIHVEQHGSTTIAAIATQLGFSPVELGKFDKGGEPLHVVGGQPWRASVSEPGGARLIASVKRRITAENAFPNENGGT